MSSETPRRATKTQKGQHLDPIRVTALENSLIGDDCYDERTRRTEENSNSNSSIADRDVDAETAKQVSSKTQCSDFGMGMSDGAAEGDVVKSQHAEENVNAVKSEHTIPHGNFKLGGDSIDFTDAAYNVTSDGFLSPASPTSPISPDSDGIRSPRKSSMRDPNRLRSPPGTPTKSVHFADQLGLDLETVKTILRTESPPDLHIHVDEDKQTISAKALALCFQQPGGKPNFMSRLYSLNVCLENVVVHEFTLIGTIKVRNLGFHKEVRIRQSSDNWTTYVDTMAMYVDGSHDGPTDRFSFGLSGPRSMAPGSILSFAIYYKVAGQIFWDNNGGQNYSLVCEEIKKA